MFKNVYRITMAAIVTVIGAVAVLLPTSANAEPYIDISRDTPAFFVFGEGNGRVAVTLGVEETHFAGRADITAESVATWVCDYGVFPAIKNFRSYDRPLCINAVRVCSADAVKSGKQAGITFTYNENNVNMYKCWTYAFGGEMIQSPGLRFASWQVPSPTENFEILDMFYGLTKKVQAVTPYLKYKTPEGVLQTAHVFHDYFVFRDTRETANLNRLTFMDWSGKPRVAWRTGNEFISYNYAFAGGHNLFMDPNLCLRAGLCSKIGMLPYVDHAGNKLLARLQTA